MGTNQDIGAYQITYSGISGVSYMTIQDGYSSSGVVSIFIQRDPDSISMGDDPIMTINVSSIVQEIVFEYDEESDTEIAEIEIGVEADDEVIFEYVGTGDISIGFKEFAMGDNLNAKINETFDGEFDEEWEHDGLVLDFEINPNALTWGYNYPSAGSGWTTVYLLSRFEATSIDDLYINFSILGSDALASSLLLFRDDTYLNATSETIDDATPYIVIDESASEAGFVKLSDYIDPEENHGNVNAIGYCRHHDAVAE